MFKTIKNITNNIKDKINIVKIFYDATKVCNNNKIIDSIYKTKKPTFINKFSSIRRLLLLAILYFNYKIWNTTNIMYTTTGKVDMQWVIYATAWTAMLTIYISFYTTSRTKEIDSYNTKEVEIEKAIIDSNNNCNEEEPDMSNMDKFGDVSNDND